MSTSGTAHELPLTRGLLDAVIARRQQNLAAALTRTRSPIPAVAAYARASAAWHANRWRGCARTGPIRVVVEA